jgi:hypothetical protein
MDMPLKPNVLEDIARDVSYTCNPLPLRGFKMVIGAAFNTSPSTPQEILL